jgi:ABC-type glycerol-3-phosphate transport system substrate-binding protein
MDRQTSICSGPYNDRYRIQSSGILDRMVLSMQQIYGPGRAIFLRRWLAPAALLFAAFALGAGCIERPTTIDLVPPRPHEGVTLRLATADSADRRFLSQLTRGWAVRSGAEVRIVEEPWDGSADVGLIPVADLGHWAESGKLAAAPADLRLANNSYRWEDLFPPYGVRLTSWGERTYALPVIAEGMVLAYRKDLFDGKDGRPASPPADWAKLLTYRPSFGERYLAPLPADPDRLAAEFFTAAACYDRLAVGRVTAEDLIRDGGRFFAFQFDATTGEPRLDAPAFQHVAKLFQAMTPFRCRAVDAVEAFKSGEAKVGVLSLAELARVGPDVADKLGVAPLPGARSVFDAAGELKANAQETVNRVPYLGWSGRLGVVSTRCANPAAAWELLAELGMPDRAALDLIADSRWGAGPYRISQLESRARPRWFGFGLSATETDRLTAALHDNLGRGVQNYRIRLRTPNHGELDAALDQELRKAIAGSDPADMTRANKRWKDIIAKQKPEDWKAAARKSLGF